MTTRLAAALLAAGGLLAGLAGLTPPAPVAAAECGGAPTQADLDASGQLLARINAYRQQNGRAALTADGTLAKAAGWMARDMVGRKDGVGHIDSLNRNIGRRLAECGYSGFDSVVYKENVCCTVAGGGAIETPEEAFEAWRTSQAGHNEAMLDTAMRFAGVGRSCDAQTCYWALDVGSQGTGAPMPAPVPGGATTPTSPGAGPLGGARGQTQSDAAAAAAPAGALVAPYLEGYDPLPGATSATVDAEVVFIDKTESETGYEIRARTRPAANGVVSTSLAQGAAVPGTGSTARRTIQGLTPGTEYCFSVRATRLVNGSYSDSPWSNERCWTPPAVVWPFLTLGSTGEAVRTVQYLLRQHGATLDVDGDFGPETRSAVGAFNRANGLGGGALGSGRTLRSSTWEKLIVPVQQGSQGEAVRAVQSQLASRGMAVAVDGDFGPQTAQAVTAYKQPRGLGSSAVVDTATWAALVNGK
jgi:peptidoglycan hydrolase-like protein with peptidoglycan-binding domain/uncharacterized protein YkwD